MPLRGENLVVEGPVSSSRKPSPRKPSSSNKPGSASSPDCAPWSRGARQSSSPPSTSGPSGNSRLGPSVPVSCRRYFCRCDCAESASATQTADATAQLTHLDVLDGHALHAHQRQHALGRGQVQAAQRVDGDDKALVQFRRPPQPPLALVPEPRSGASARADVAQRSSVRRAAALKEGAGERWRADGRDASPARRGDPLPQARARAPRRRTARTAPLRGGAGVRTCCSIGPQQRQGAAA